MKRTLLKKKLNLDLLADLERRNVAYAELRFAPGQHLQRGRQLHRKLFIFHKLPLFSSLYFHFCSIIRKIYRNIQLSLSFCRRTQNNLLCVHFARTRNQKRRNTLKRMLLRLIIIV